MTDFNGRPVLVTGAAGGIGGATVRQLVLAGADVIASDRTAESLAQLDARGDVQPCHSSSRTRTASALR